MEHDEKLVIKLVMEAIDGHMRELKSELRRDMERETMSIKELIKDRSDLVREDIKSHEEHSAKRAAEHEERAKHRHQVLCEDKGPKV